VNIITVGRFVEQKNYPLALRLFKQLKDAGDLPPMRYTIIGYGPLEKQIRDLIRQMGLEDDVRLLINPGQVDKHLAQADIYLSTSLFEGLSNAIMEGMSHGLPVVASRVGDNEHLVHEGKNGFLHSVEDEAGMYGSLRKLVWDQLLRQQFGLQSALIIQRDFSFCGFQQKYIDLIEDQRIPLHETV
jgi:glycosyltransferase involved in cell wall biosynthesis